MEDRENMEKIFRNARKVLEIIEKCKEKEDDDKNQYKYKNNL